MANRSVQQRNLLVACARGEYDFLEEYIRKNPQKRKYEVFDNHKWGPLHHAVASNSYDCVQLLLASGLVDTQWKSFEGQTCLFVAVERNASQAIIKSLLKFDAELFNQPNNERVYPIHRAVLTDSLETVRTMVETLNEMRVPIHDQFDWDLENSLFLAARKKNYQMVEYLIECVKCDVTHTNDSGLNAITVSLLPCQENVEREEWNRFEIFTKLMPKTYDTSAPDFMQQMLLPISFTLLFKQREIFVWIMEQFYLTEMNEHRDLVQTLLNAFELVDFDYQPILAGLHSKITQFVVKPGDTLKNDLLYQNMFTNLRNIFIYDRDLFCNIVNVLRPKLHEHSINYLMLKSIPELPISTQMLSDYLQMFDILHIEDLLDIQSLFDFAPSNNIFLENILLILMPFSMAPSADVYIDNCRKDRPISSTIQLDDGLAKFCVNGTFRVKCGLKSLCRTAIRSHILSNCANGTTNYQRLNCMRSMLLPIPIKNFLLFNYSCYDFK